MQKALTNKPVFDKRELLLTARAWKDLPVAPGQNRTVVEWGVGRGPSVYVYPAAKRTAGVSVAQLATSGSDERWADFLEYEFVPEVVEALSEAGHTPHVLCVDQRPILIQRERRRAMEARSHH
jgi:hypothetical protein